MMRVVIDTNVFIHGLFTQGQNFMDQACKNIIQAIRRDHIRVVGNEAIISEYVWMILGRLYQVKRNLLDIQAIYFPAIVKVLSTIEKVPHETTIPDSWIKDSDDKMFLECAADGKVNIIVSEDRSLLDFEKTNMSLENSDALSFLRTNNISVLSPVEFERRYL